MNSYDEDLDDRLADYCETNHNDKPVEDCPNCDARRTTQHCGYCESVYDNGCWYEDPRHPLTLTCDHTPLALVDDWGKEITCTVLVSYPTTARRAGYKAPCRDHIETPGKTACTFHQRIIDSEECARVYQRLVAQRAS